MMTPEESPRGDEQRSAVDQQEFERILKERADALAASDADVDLGETGTFVVLRLGSERYAVPIGSVHEIKPMGDVTALPATPPFWLGLTNLRGNLYPVLDLGRYLGTQVEATATDAQIVVIGDAGVAVGLRVDEVVGVRTVALADIGPPLVEPRAERADVHVGLTDDLLAILDVDALLADPSLIVSDGLE